MKYINATIVSQLINAHYTRDEDSFKHFANLIADAFEEQGNEHGAQMVRDAVDNPHENK